MTRRTTCILIVLFVLCARAQEKIVLNTPVFTGSGADFRLLSLLMRRTHPDSPAVIVATYAEVSGTTFLAKGRTIVCQYDGSAADTLIIALNKVNLSTTSMEKRVTQQCQADGKLGAGTISGTPQ